MVIARAREWVQCQAMGTYVGTATLLDQQDGTQADVRVSLAAADNFGDRWFGTVQGLTGEGLTLDGHEVLVELPAGTRSRARVVIDLTGKEPVVRLIGTGRAPV